MKFAGLLIAIAFLLSGCAGLTGSVDVNDLAMAATDRIGAHVQIRAAETAVAGKALDAMKAETELEIAKTQATPQAVLNIKDPQSMALYQLGEANRQLAAAGKLMGEIALALTTGKSKYASFIQFTPFPVGAFAEGMNSFFGGIANVARTPVATVLGGGASAAWLAKEVRKANSGTVYYGDATLENSLNTSSMSIGGDGSTGTLAPSVEVVEPEVVYGIEAAEIEVEE